jgi:hypothetical protein
MADFETVCPHCDQPLECPEEAIGITVNCPSCNGEIIIAAPADSEPPAAEQAAGEHWVVDVRILVRGAPPAFLKVLIEGPKTWVLPHGVLSEPALCAVSNAVHTKYPQCPVTPVTVHTADPVALRHCEDETTYCDATCRTWLLGKPHASL